MFKFLESDDQSQLPTNKYCTLEDLTTFPIPISKSEIIMQYNPTDANHNPTWTRVKDFRSFIKKYSNPPDSFFDGKNAVKAEFDSFNNGSM